MLQVAGLAKSTYEYYKSNKHLNAVKRRESKDKEILDIIKPVFDAHKSRYGYRRIILALKKELFGINHKCGILIWCQENIWFKFKWDYWKNNS